MVQVDIFWAYGLGASLAAASGRQLLKDDIPNEKSPFNNSFFLKTVLYLALVWNLTGLLLLIKHPSWETMQVFKGIEALQSLPFLVLGFSFTNVSQGILGFWVTYKLFEKGKFYFGHLNWLAGYFCMFFILLYGWDGLGYDRFIYDRDMIAGSPAWTPGAGCAGWAYAGTAVINFIGSSVARTLYLDGVYLVPPLFYLFGKWTKEGSDMDSTLSEDKKLKAWYKPSLIYAFSVFGIGLTSAAMAAFTVYGVGLLLGAETSTAMHVLSYFIGLPLFAVVAWFLFYRKGGIVYKIFQGMFLEEPQS